MGVKNFKGDEVTTFALGQVIAIQNDNIGIASELKQIAL